MATHDWPTGSERHDAPPADWPHLRERLPALISERDLDALQAVVDALATELLGLRDALTAARLEVARLTRLLDSYEFVPFRDALNYTRRHYGLPPLPGTVVTEIDRALEAARLQGGKSVRWNV